MFLDPVALQKLIPRDEQAGTQGENSRRNR